MRKLSMRTPKFGKQRMSSAVLEDIKFLKKYEFGGRVKNEAEMETVNRLASLGLMKKGVELKGEGAVTATVTSLGLKLIS